MESIGYTGSDDFSNCNGNGHKNGLKNNYKGDENGFKSDNNVHLYGHTNGTGIAPDESPGDKHVPIAICGMGMRLPGGIRNDTALYDFLINKQDARAPTGTTRYNIDAYYSPHSKPGTINTKHGYFLNDIDFSKFDLSMFNMTPAEVERLDPNQRLLLEVVWEAFESSGEINWRGKNIGSYVGVFAEDWHDLHAKDSNDFAPYQLMGSMDFVLGNRISYEYDLKGPSMTIKVACSSAALCLHKALQAIRQGECYAAIVAGANLIMAPGLTIGMTALRTLSPDGSSKSFDASANGYARGEAVAALYVKRLDKAIRDRNPIRAVIRSSASNADGKTPGIAFPNPEAQEALIRQAYKMAGLDLSQTALVECHGTGTAVGDPREVKVIANCFGENGIYIGSVKPNLGHSEGASAITSIVKAVLSLEHKTIIPNIKFNKPNPAIPWESAKLVVPVDLCPWPENRCERISVNSFGIGGSNVHFVLDSAASFGLEAPKSKSFPSVQTLQQLQKPRKSLLLFSANHPESLNAITRNYETYLTEHPGCINDLAYTLAQHREHLKYRSFSVTDGAAPFKFSHQTKSQAPIQIAFIFTGQGAQWAHMGRQLMTDFPSFLANIRSMDETLKKIEHGPPWTIEEILSESEGKDCIYEAEYSQPICTALQIALIDLLATWGVNPLAVVGHSSGEIAAAYAAHALTKKEAVIAAYYRGYVCKTPKFPGGMAVIGLGRADVIPYLVPGVGIACENSGSSVTISGDLEPLEYAMSAISQHFPNVLVRRLKAGMAYHSHHTKLVGDIYHDLVAKYLVPQLPKIPFYSSVKAKVLSKASDFGPKYWQENLESPVLFYSAVKCLVKGIGQYVHLEIGPHSALLGPLKQIYKETSTPIQYVSTLIRGHNDTESFLEAVGKLFSSGVKIHFPVVSGNEKVLTDLPTYPWHYDKSYWSETRVMKNWRFRKHLPHDLLGNRTLEGPDLEPSWRSNFRVADVPWIKDHCVNNDIVFPAAAYITMAGEAIFQLTGTQGYTVRNVSFSTTMVLNADKSTEIITSLRPRRLTSTLESDWYEFNIVSHDGETWTRHCSGLVTSGRASLSPPPKVKSYPRKVSSKRWYTTMSRVGLNFGPRFTGLENITSGITESSAAVSILDRQEDAESLYLLHPTTLDLVFQSWTVAASRGEYRTFKTLFLPTFIEELYVGSGTRKEIYVNTNSSDKSFTAYGSSYGVVDGEIVFFLKGFKGTPIGDFGTGETSDLTVLSLQWKPDFQFLSAGELMKPVIDVRKELVILERLYILCAIESSKALQGITTLHPYLEKYRSWIFDQCDRFKQPGYPLVEDSAKLVNMDESERHHLIHEILGQFKNTNAEPVAVAIWRTYNHLIDVFEGQSDFLDILLQDGILPGIYNWMNNLWDFQNFFKLLGHSQPQMRILEIGAGTGGLTAKILENLKSDFGERLYLKYTFTDISSGFFVQSKERFREYEGIEYRVLDISKDPLDQGFNSGEYDLIIASNVLHATPFLHETLKNVRSLLQPMGRLFLQELSPIVKCMGFIMGLFSGWWLGEHDGRVIEPFISPEEWRKKLRNAGFDGCDSATLDNEWPYHINANIVAKPAINFEYPKKMSLLSGLQIHPLALHTERLLLEEGYEVQHYKWGQELPSDQDLISFIDLDKPLFHDINEVDLQHFLQFVESLQQSAVLWLTPPAQIHPTDPNAALVLGIARSIRSELGMSFATLELESGEKGSTETIVKVLRKIQRCRGEISDLGPDMEFALANGVVNLSRFHWCSLEKSLCQTAKPPDAKELVIGKPGLLQTLKWSGQKFHDLGPEEVQTKIVAVGMNFRDIAIAMGIDNNREALNKRYNGLGSDGAGYVTKVGSDIKHLKVGDRIMMIGTNSAGLATEIQRPGKFCIKIPDQLSFGEAATLPGVYITALRCFLDKADLQKGQTVLIHNGAGGVGIAAINVAKWIGAEIYTTVSTEEKASFLFREFAISRDHIFKSRDTSFLDGIMEATNGLGVDVVLNSVSGELLHASWRCVAANGCMLEIGKRDTMGRGLLAMDKFEDNRSFIGIDLTRLTVVDRPCISRLLAQTIDLYNKGFIRPIRPITIFDAERAQEAFRYMQKGMHIGKVVITFPNKDQLPLAPTVPNPVFRGDVSYLLVGGLGGLGRSIATWMASHGAKNLIFLSRSAGESDTDQAFSRELNIAGCSVQCFPCDIANRDAVKNAIDQASKPIAGIMQMAMVLRDIGVMNMSLDSWNAALRPKVEGTWNLHSLAPKDLDFFVLFGSTAGIFGMYGQENYASANTFLDAFVQYRQNLGLPASVMDIGAIVDVGYISRTPSAMETMVASSARLLTEQDFLDYLQLAIARSSGTRTTSESISPVAGYYNPSQITQALECHLPIMDPQNNIIWKHDPRMAIYRNIEKAFADRGREVADGLKLFLSSVMADPSKLDQKASVEILTREIGNRVSTFLMKGEEAIDTSLTLAAIGIDSLVVIEIRNWWKQHFGIEVSVSELMSGRSIEQLGELAAWRLKEKIIGKGKAAT